MTNKAKREEREKKTIMTTTMVFFMYCFDHFDLSLHLSTHSLNLFSFHRRSFVNEFVITYLLLILTSFYHNNSICLLRSSPEIPKWTKKTLSNEWKGKKALDFVQSDHVGYECVASSITIIRIVCTLKAFAHSLKFLIA